MKTLLLLLLAAASSVKCHKSCLEDLSEAERLSELYRTCALSAEGEVEKETSSSSNNRLCDLLQLVIKRCTPIFKSCFVPEDFRSFQDSQIELFLQASQQIYRVESVATNCSVARSYLSRKSKQEAGRCGTQRNEDAWKHYHKCTGHISGEVQNELTRHTSHPAKQQQILCNGVFKAVYGCALLLQECFSEEEVVRTVTNQKELLRRLVKGGAEINHNSNLIDLDACTVYGGNVGSDVYKALKDKARNISNVSSSNTLSSGVSLPILLSLLFLANIQH